MEAPVEQCPWGRLVPGEARSVCGSRVWLAEEAGFLVYRRSGPHGRREALLPRGVGGVELAPMPPLLYPERVGYVLVRLPAPVVVPPGGAVRLVLRVELDAAAVLPEGGLVDAFPTGRGRLGVYGPPSGGVLARLVAASQAPPGPCSALLEAVLRNQWRGGAVEYRRLLLPGPGLSASPGPGCRPRLPRVVAEARGPREARVVVEQPRAQRPQRPLPLPVALGSRAEAEMRHGL